MTAVEAPRTWLEIGSKWQCDTPEAYLDSSRGKVPTLDQCKESCAATLECKSITYFNSKWCSHYSALCTKTTWNNKVDASYVYGTAPTTTTTPTTTTKTTRKTTTGTYAMRIRSLSRHNI